MRRGWRSGVQSDKQDVCSRFRATALRTGVMLHPETMPGLRSWTQRFGAVVAQPLES